MEDVIVFEKLKDAILLKYRSKFSYSDKSLTNFGTKEIRQLLSLIEEDCNQKISEKWVYTYLKPTTITKLPRKDMLDILTTWLGYSGWDEFKVKSNNTQHTKFRKKGIKICLLAICCLSILMSMSFYLFKPSHKRYTICFYDQYLQTPLQENKLSVFLVSKNLKKLVLKENCIQVNTRKDSITLKTESPYYKDHSFTVKYETDTITLFLQPDDYTLMLHNYMNSNIENWKKRRTQLDGIIHNNAEIIEMMKNNIGVDFLNKTEFIDKITTPIKSVDHMEIIDIKYNKDKQITSLRFIQK